MITTGSIIPSLSSPAKLRPGVSLAETMLALAVTTLIGVTAMTVMGAVSNAQRVTDANAETIQAARAGMDRLQRTIRAGKLVTAASATQLIVWTGDRQDLGYINCEEVGVINYNAAARTITMTKVTFPASMSDATKRPLNAIVDFSMMDTSAHAITAMGNVAYRGDMILAADVQSCTFSVSPDVPETQSITIKATFGSGGQQLSMVSTTTMHASSVAMLDEDDETGDYSLQEPAESWGDLSPGLK